ncbi:MAG: hypothetical protein LBS83_03445, partial [Holosporales bacterium]|nr:hypothetical protein [Holosporales bacterium]
MLNLKKSLLITSLFVCGQSLQAEKFGVVIDKDRVAATFGNSGGSVFQYDEVGNLANEKRVSEAGKVLSERQYEYSDASKLWQVKDLLGDSVKSTHFGYDSLGRLTKVGDASMSYNQFNMMEAFKKPGVDARYTYNPLTGLRDAKVVNDKFTRFVLDDQERVVEERDMIGNVVSKITYDKNGPETYTRDGKTYRYVFNHLGDVVALKDSNGKVVNRYSYDVWGNLTLSQETVENPIRSRGEYYDSESGFYYLRGRYYDPNARRFTT